MKLHSLRARIRWTIIGLLATVLLPLGMLSYQRTIAEVDELSDGRLAQSARTLEALIGHDSFALGSPEHAPIDVPAFAADPKNTPRNARTYESEVGYQVVDRQGNLRISTSNLLGMPAIEAPDRTFKDVAFGGYRWRVFTLRKASGELIRTAERYDSRDEIAYALWIQHGLPLFIGIPLLAILVGWGVQRNLRPLDVLADKLFMRKPGSHALLTLENAPSELQPVLDALNEQIARLEEALERERRFSADVAHELRTPLASTMINLESAMHARDATASESALISATECLASLARRTEQLLALARLEGAPGRQPLNRVDLVAVTGAVIDEMVAVIVTSGVELSLAPLPDTLIVQGDEAALRALLRNLLENAMRHVPAGGHVQFALSQTRYEAVIDVVDDGPGIPAERRSQVFDRFHRESSSRGDGYGLGLSIVKRAAQMHGANIQLLDSPLGRGLHVRVGIPLPDDSQA
ncbi:MAG TPA: ATP-binding protein [Dyella sp.]|uniref:ATP-binding protein n=1 Tax=Dyella sp. TaxID=1869338 RepID=UPI002F91EB44